MNAKAEWAVVPLVILAAFLYMSLDGLPLDSPSNIKAADPFYHTFAAEAIVDTGHWNHYPAWLAFGNTNGVSIQPPLLYVQDASLSKITHVPVWATMYFLVCLFMAMGIGIGYFVIQRAFNNTPIALLSAMALVLPLRPSIWLYSMFIGLWIQVISYTFVVGFIWMALRYLKERQTWMLWMANLCVVVIMACHPQDLIPIFPIWLLLAWKAWKNQKRVQQLVALISASLLLFIILLPRFIFIWGGWGGGLALGLHAPPAGAFDTSYGGGLGSPYLWFFPAYMLIIAAIGLLAMILQHRRFRNILIFIAGVALLMYGTPFIVKDPYYFLRLRALQPFLFAPLAALAVVSGLWYIRMDNRIRWAAVVVVGLVVLGVGYYDYNQLAPQLVGGHINADKWQAYQWIHANTPADSRIIMLEGTQQANPVYVKRTTAAVDFTELAKEAPHVMNNETVVWNAPYAGDAMRSPLKLETGFLRYTLFPEPSPNATLTDFDYIYMENQNQDIATLNAKIIAGLPGYTVVYNRAGYIILGRRHA